MKHIKPKPSILLSLIAIVTLTTCEERKYDNPYDPQVNIDSLAPYNLQVEHLGIFEKKLTWECDAEHAESFVIDKKTGEENWQNAVATVSGDTHEWIDTDIELDKTHYYRIRTRFDEQVTQKTSVEFEEAFPEPSNFQTEKLSDKSYKLSWTDNSSGEQGFKIDRKTADGQWKTAYGTVEANHTEFIDTNVFVNPAKGLNVKYRLYAYYEGYESEQILTSTDAALIPPADLQIIRNPITTATLQWTDNSNGEDGFKIERKYKGGNWEEIATVTETHYQDTDFDLNTQVFYRVSAYVGQYHSSFVESDFDATIPPPENLEITANSISSVTLNWDYNTTGHEGFKIDRKVNDGAWENDFAVVDSETTNFSDENVDLVNNEYTYRVYAYLEGYKSAKMEKSIYIPDIGEVYAGGIVFYLDGQGGGLVCAESDQHTDAEWGCWGTAIGGTGTGIGDGAANTAAIVAGCSESGIAARICDELELNGYSDWFLPSIDELNLMYENLHQAGMGGFADNVYWSSSEYSSSIAWGQSFSDGGQYNYGKDYYIRVRAVRAF
ncbi:MAG: DUF1566 domain-containing protein [Bacteroidales bacterium]|nr:DUF1566 domain-containing protein [Bacteroidales bacterium]